MFFTDLVQEPQVERACRGGNHQEVTDRGERNKMHLPHFSSKATPRFYNRFYSVVRFILYCYLFISLLPYENVVLVFRFNSDFFTFQRGGDHQEIVRRKKD